MADVKWIKITTDMFDNRKIKHIRRLPEGNSIVLIWVMLLTMAGRCNAGGMIFLTENIAYTPKMLADELDFEENTVLLALKALQEFGMVSMDGNSFCIANWQEYQNIEGMEKIREQNRLRKQKQRQKALLPAECDVSRDCPVTVTQCHATEIDKDKEIDRDKENISMGASDDEPSPKPKRKKAKPFVPPTVEEVAVYCKKRENGIDAEEFVDFYTSKGWMIGKTKMQDWQSAVRTWERKRKEERGVNSGTSSTNDTARIAEKLGTWL